MEFYWDYTVASLIKDISEEMFSAKVNYDEENKRLVVSVPNGINLVFYENCGGYPVLVLNMMPEMLQGKANLYLSLLKRILKWRYRFFPEPYRFRSGEFEGYHFYGWEPNGYFPMFVYIWNDQGWNSAKIRKLILGILNEKEEQV